MCVTHGHIDHIGDSIEIAKKTGAVFIGTPELGFFAQKNGIPEEGGELCPLNIGGSCTVKGIEVTMTDAVHTSDIMIGETETVTGSGSCGYVLAAEDGTNVYFARAIRFGSAASPIDSLGQISRSLQLVTLHQAPTRIIYVHWQCS